MDECNCFRCGDAMVKRHHINPEVTAIQYSYWYCESCQSKYDMRLKELE